jgi:hypothetical protein
MAVGHGPQQDGSWPMEDRTAGASLGSLPGVKPSADRGCRETDATVVGVAGVLGAAIGTLQAGIVLSLRLH